MADRVAKIYDWIKETIKANAGDAKERLQKKSAMLSQIKYFTSSEINI